MSSSQPSSIAQSTQLLSLLNDMLTKLDVIEKNLKAQDELITVQFSIFEKQMNEFREQMNNKRPTKISAVYD